MRTTDGPKGAHVYISIGHRIGLSTAVEVVREACTGRIPQPVYIAGKCSIPLFNLFPHALSSTEYKVKQELLKADPPKPKNVPGPKGGNNRRNNNTGGKGPKKEGGKTGGLPNGKGSPNQDGKGKRGPRGPRVRWQRVITTAPNLVHFPTGRRGTGWQRTRTGTGARTR